MERSPPNQGLYSCINILRVNREFQKAVMLWPVLGTKRSYLCKLVRSIDVIVHNSQKELPRATR